HVEDAVTVRDVGSVRLDRLGQFDLAMEHPSVRVQRMDGEPVLGRGHFQGLAGCAPELEGDVDRRGVDDDFRDGLTSQTTFVGNRRGRPQCAWAPLANRGKTPMTAASVAEEMAWLPTRIGSITFSFFMSVTLPLNTLIPAALFPFLCCWRSSIRMSIGSRPAFSARVRGMTSTASANASMAICSRP